MIEPRDPYRVLGVAPGSPQREIRDAYRSRARMAHPDLAGDESAASMRDLNAAWEILKDPVRRAEFDRSQGREGTGEGAGPGGAAGGTGSEERSDRRDGEPWRGAAGAPPGKPYGTVLDAGIYAGWSLSQVIGRDRGYLAWFRDRPEGRRYAAEIDRMLERAGGESRTRAADGGRGRRR